MTPGEAAVMNASAGRAAPSAASAVWKLAMSRWTASGSLSFTGPVQAGGLGGLGPGALAQEPGQAILHVVGLARLPRLAVADDVPPGPHLLLDHLRRRRPDARLQSRAVDRLTLLPGEHHLHEVVRAGQATGMGGEDPL